MVSWQALHLAGASLGAGAPASYLPLQGAKQWLTVAELTWCVPQNTICTRLEHNLHRHCQCSRTCKFLLGEICLIFASVSHLWINQNSLWAAEYPDHPSTTSATCHGQTFAWLGQQLCFSISCSTTVPLCSCHCQPFQAALPPAPGCCWQPLPCLGPCLTSLSSITLLRGTTSCPRDGFTPMSRDIHPPQCHLQPGSPSRATAASSTATGQPRTAATGPVRTPTTATSR